MDCPLTVIYDSECKFCIAQIDLIKKLSLNQTRLLYLPRNSENIEKTIPKVKEFDFSKGLLFVNEDGKIFIGADAIYYISLNLKVLRYFSFLYLIPFLKPLFKFMYYLVAKNRYFLSKFCNSENCSI